MQALAISNLMLPFLNGDKEERKCYLKTMNNLSHRMNYWLNEDFAKEIKEFMPGDEFIIGEYNNVAVIMCEQYLDRFPESYSELEEDFSPQYLVSETDIYLYNLELYFAYSTYSL